MWATLIAGLLGAGVVLAGPPRLLFDPSDEGFLIASANTATPILVYSSLDEAVRIAANTFAEDVERVTGQRPPIYVDDVPSNITALIVISTAGSSSSHQKRSNQVPWSPPNGLEGNWESYHISEEDALIAGVDRSLHICGSDKRGTIYGLYTLSELMGVSPWYWWADVSIMKREHIVFPKGAVLSHGPPTVKYRGFFLNDEQPVLWNWAKDHFKMGQKPPFQVGMYEKVFELLLRLKANYAWPAMWASMFAVDGMDLDGGKLPDDPTPGPNQELASRMGIVMGTSHHEPMSRNQKEFTTWGEGPWNFEENEAYLTQFWEYGAKRAKGLETVFTVGMRGDGDLPLDGANVELLQNITARQQGLLQKTYGDTKKVPQMWAMYKEVMGYYANGLRVPEEVTALLADDNWGNLMAVSPDSRRKSETAGIYYHADYVGDPRDYKWINTVPLAKMWEQLHVAKSYDMTDIWILNVGDLKFLETPIEFFLSIAYDSDSFDNDSLPQWLERVAARDFGPEYAEDIAVMLAQYSMYASRRKAELLDTETYSLVTFEEFDRILADWEDLERRATEVHAKLGHSQTSFYEMLLVQVQLQTNLHRLYNAAAKSNLYATQGRTAANAMADLAYECFERDHELAEEFNRVEDGKWNHMLSQTHIGYQYWQMPVRNSLPPTSRISRYDASFFKGERVNIRYTVIDSLGAWPGDNQHNSPAGYEAPDPTLWPMDEYGQDRWVDVSSGGPEEVNFTAVAEHDWVKVHPSSGTIKGDGSTDTRVRISVDWTKVSSNLTRVTFTSSDNAPPLVVTIPLHRFKVPAGFKGAVQGDGYVALEAPHFDSSTASTINDTEHSWKEIPYYGRTHSGMSMYPVGSHRFENGTGPSMGYSFWCTSSLDAELVLHLGPSLNYVLGSKMAFAVEVDKAGSVEIEPIPSSDPGTLPHDWEQVVANDVREIKVPLGDLREGPHTITIYGITPGLVFERVMVDLGGIRGRGPTYLGPLESRILQ